MFQIGDLVTRKSYNNDIVFKIIKIEDDNYYLMGVTVRLSADAPIDDLLIYNDDKEDDFSPIIDEYRNLERNEYFYLPGRILHIDSDKYFLDKCMKFYKKNKVKAYGVYSNYDELSDITSEYLNKYLSPSIVDIINKRNSIEKSGSIIENFNNVNFYLYPLISSSDALGSIILVDDNISDSDKSIIRLISAFLIKNVEE